MFIGLLISWVFLVPHYTQRRGRDRRKSAAASTISSAASFAKARFVGAGTIGVAAIWTLLRIIGPIISGIRWRSPPAASARRVAPTSCRSPSGTFRSASSPAPSSLSMIPIGLLLYAFGKHRPDRRKPGRDDHLSIIYILIAGVVIAAVCGYMAGLIGASNSPISGVGILSVVGISLILAAMFPQGRGDETKSLVAFALFVTALMFGVATISNNNLQDLKTGQLVDATPWRQQVALVLGVIFGALVIPPILDLINTAFGFQGAPGAKANALAAPQAAIISTIAQGVLGGNLDWGLIGRAPPSASSPSSSTKC